MVLVFFWNETISDSLHCFAPRMNRMEPTKNHILCIYVYSYPFTINEKKLKTGGKNG
jgi:hypothetical protein